MNLAWREKRALLVLAGVLASLVLYLVVLAPFFEQRRSLLRSMAAQQETLAELRSLQAELQARNRRSRRVQDVIAQRKKDFSLFSFLEQAARSAGIQGHVRSMTPLRVPKAESQSRTAVEVKLEGIGLDALLQYLSRIDRPAEAVRIGRMALQRTSGDTPRLDAVIQVVTLESQAGRSAPKDET